MVGLMVGVVFGGTSPQFHHESQPTASALAQTTVVTTATGCETMDATKVITADPLLMALVAMNLPGTGGTKTPGTPGTKADLGWLDNGVWSQVPTRIMLDDATQYPAVLGDAGNGQVSGQTSMLMGANYVVRTAGNYDPRTTVYLPEGGSQGAMGVRQAMIIMAKNGVPMDQVFGVMYSDPYTAGTGIAARFGPGQIIPTTGIEGGVPDVPAGATALSISNRYDPMAHMPKYLWTLPITGLNAILGFVFEHGDISKIDYGDPGNTVRRDGNVTYISIAPKIIPILMPIVFAAYLAGVPTNVTASILKPLDDVLRPIIDMGGQDVPGGFQLAPSPVEFAGQLFKVAQGVVNAMTDTVKLVTGQPVFASKSVPSPVQQLIDQAKQKDAELNGGATTPDVGTSVTTPVSAVSPVTDPVQQESPQVQGHMVLKPSTTSKESANQTPQPSATDKNGTDNQVKNTPAPSGDVTPSQPVTPPADQPKVTPSKPADDTRQHSGSQKDGDQGDTPKGTVKPDKNSDVPKGDTKKPGKGDQKDGDDQTGTTPQKRETKAPKQESTADKKDADTAKPAAHAAAHAAD